MDSKAQQALLRLALYCAKSGRTAADDDQRDEDVRFLHDKNVTDRDIDVVCSMGLQLPPAKMERVKEEMRFYLR